MSESEREPEGQQAVGVAQSRIGADLVPRVASGLLLGAVALAMTVAGETAFAVLVIIVALVLGWEFGRLVRGNTADLAMALQAVAVAAAAILASLGMAGPGLLVLAIGGMLAGLTSFANQAVLSGFGVIYAGLPVVGLIWLRSDPGYGLAAVLFVLVIAVTADTAAFFAGRLIGGAKLMPRVSPKKTWAGFAGAIIASVVASLAFARYIANATPLRLAALAAGLAVAAQIGDLAESALKRSFGAKDASNLIPGHGGVMDRVDGIVAAATVAAFIASVTNVLVPGRALLLGH